MMSSCVLRPLLTWLRNTVDSTSRKIGEELRWPDLHAMIIHFESKSARIAPLNTLTVSYTQSLLTKPILISIQLLGHPNPNHTILHYRDIPCFNKLVDSVRYFLQTTLLHCWAIPNYFTLLSYTQPQLNFEKSTTFLYCWAIPNFITLLSYTQSYHIAEVNLILIACLAIPYLSTLPN